MPQKIKKNTNSLSSSEELIQLAEKLDAQAQEGLKPETNAPIQALATAIAKFAKSSSGSWIGYQANVYYEGFNPPPPGAHFSSEWGIQEMYPSSLGSRGAWREYDPDEVKNAIYKEAGDPDLTKLRDLANSSEKTFKNAQSEILSILSAELSMQSDEYLSDVKTEIQRLEFSNATETLRKMAGTGGYSSRDAIAVHQGKKAPPHKKIEAEIAALHNATALLVELGALAKKAASHIERKQKPKGASMTKAEFADWNIDVIAKLLRNFHKMARQLKHRHDKRVAMLIEDEYDIQDFLHSVLRGFFDDIRAEEYSPSYAGGASRLDFLLKREEVVIETKMASAKLKDKDVGEQLIIDIARYKSHPDCKHLVCFVYDPHNHLKNPAGLETDLSKKHDKLNVQVIVVSPS